MKSPAQNPNSLNVLLIGNNPMEMGTVLDKLKQVRAQKIITEIAFDLRSILERLMRFNPNFIFIDDNIFVNDGLMSGLQSHRPVLFADSYIPFD